jgi:hypothetical protein
LIETIVNKLDLLDEEKIKENIAIFQFIQILLIGTPANQTTYAAMNQALNPRNIWLEETERLFNSNLIKTIEVTTDKETINEKTFIVNFKENNITIK